MAAGKRKANWTKLPPKVLLMEVEVQVSWAKLGKLCEATGIELILSEVTQTLGDKRINKTREEMVKPQTANQDCPQPSQPSHTPALTLWPQMYQTLYWSVYRELRKSQLR